MHAACIEREAVRKIGGGTRPVSKVKLCARSVEARGLYRKGSGAQDRWMHAACIEREAVRKDRWMHAACIEREAVRKIGGFRGVVVFGWRMAISMPPGPVRTYNP